MPRIAMLTGFIALGLCANAAAAQETSYVNEAEAKPRFIQANFTKKTDISPDEYARLEEEANRVEAFQTAQSNYGSTANYGTSSTYNATTRSSTAYPAQPYTAPAPQPVTNYQPYAAPNYQQPAQPQYQTYQSQPQPNYNYGYGYGTPQTYQASSGSHVVSKGETLYSLSKRYNVPLSSLRGANGIPGNIIYVGQVLRIPHGAQQVPATSRIPYPSQQVTGTVVNRIPNQQRQTSRVTSVRPIPSGRVYAVLPNDTISSIAEFACVNPADLAILNGVTNYGGLFPGQRLVVPANHCLG